MDDIEAAVRAAGRGTWSTLTKACQGQRVGCRRRKHTVDKVRGLEHKTELAEDDLFIGPDTTSLHQDELSSMNVTMNKPAYARAHVQAYKSHV